MRRVILLMFLFVFLAWPVSAEQSCSDETRHSFNDMTTWAEGPTVAIDDKYFTTDLINTNEASPVHHVKFKWHVVIELFGVAHKAVAEVTEYFRNGSPEKVFILDASGNCFVRKRDG